MAIGVEANPKPCLLGGEPQLVEPYGFGPHPVEVGQVAVRVTRPQSESRVVELESYVRVELPRRCSGGAFEDGSVEVVRMHLGHVCARPGGDQFASVFTDGVAEPVDVCAEGANRVGRLVGFVPHPGDELFDSEPGRSGENQGGQNPLLTLIADQRRTAVCPRTNVTEHADTHCNLLPTSEYTGNRP